ncbi:MAG: hypothetical protein ABR552_01890 [Actinomycetota bacterium]
MEPSTLAPRKKKPAAWWMLLTIAAGGFGSLGAVAVAGRGTYNVAPFKVELRAWPAFQGKTEFAVEPIGTFSGGHASAGTHRSPIDFRATIKGFTVTGADPTSILTQEDSASLRDPRAFADFFAANGKQAARSFGIKVGLLALGGAAFGGLLVSFAGMRFGRVAGAVLAGVVTVGVIGLLVQQTYDAKQFSRTCWQAPDSSSCTRIVRG